MGIEQLSHKQQRQALGRKPNTHQAQARHRQKSFLVLHVRWDQGTFVPMLKGEPRRIESCNMMDNGAQGKASYPEPAFEAKVLDRGEVARGERSPRVDDVGGGALAVVGSVRCTGGDRVAVDVDAHRDNDLRGWGTRVEERGGTGWLTRMVRQRTDGQLP